MRILFLHSRKFDYGQDLMFSGLWAHLGPGHVFGHPRPWHDFLPTRPYPKNLGYVGLRGLLQRGIAPEEADLVVVGACKPDVFATYLALQPRIPRDVPVFLLDGGDREEIGGDLARLGAPEAFAQAEARRPFDRIFKREYLKGREYPDRVQPLPFAMNLHALGSGPQPTKDMDVTFWAMESHPVRKRAFELLRGRFDCDANGTGRAESLKSYRHRGNRYHRALARSRIAISLRGGGWDTLRYWEIPALGPLMVTTPLDIVIPMDFVDRVHVVRCQSDLSDLVDLCEHYLRHEDERERIAAAGRAHLLAHHTNVARARQLLGFVGR